MNEMRSQPMPEGFKSTLVSIVPFPIIEEKPGLIPGRYELEPAKSEDEPSILHVGNGMHYVFIDEDRGSFRVVTPSYMVADSVVKDFLSSEIATAPDAYPGFFWLPGELSIKDIMTKHDDRLREMKRIQRNWFVELVKMADDDWEKTRHHYSISDTQRYAARALDPENKRKRPWMIDNPNQEVEATPLTSMTCGACGSDVLRTAILCRFCGFILDAKRYDASQFAGGKSAIEIAKAAMKVQ